ncbi:MAG: hypothetical protein KC931_03075 [Candidatus Omnitrophica bacterium]|nr:hypothetical protein [Candidatus Omnitrophota bacterium]MCA9446071.1 hypothetical protein [Candidatus Omnitrophota bacterium]MCB9783125.1 hypothetical protein [Candidatus Omnitrophota bacterium]
MKRTISRLVFVLVLLTSSRVFAQPMLPGDPAATPLSGIEVAAAASFAGTAYMVHKKKRNEK